MVERINCAGRYPGQNTIHRFNPQHKGNHFFVSEVHFYKTSTGVIDGGKGKFPKLEMPGL
jgi:hypothetical protein